MLLNKDGQMYTILYFLDYGKSFGGAAHTLLQQAILMKRLGHQTVIFFSDYSGAEMSNEYREICLKAGIEWRWATYQISSQTEDIDVRYLDRNYEELKKGIAVLCPDILHSVQLNPCVELVSRELEIPHIMNIYQMIPEFFSIDYINIFPHYHICDSWYYARMWKHYLKTDSTCIRTVAEGSDREKRSLDNRPLNYICVGGIYERKNQLTVIKAFHKALKNGIQGKLILYGYARSQYADTCANYIEENELKSNIFIKGFCAEMKTEYENSDVLLCGSTRESYPNAISEAMANKLMIISTPVAGVPEIIEDGVNGYLTKDYSIEALYEKIMEFQRDLEEGKTEKILENAEKSYRMYHSPQAIMGQLSAYYQYVLNDYSKRKGEAAEGNTIGIRDIRTIFGESIQYFDKNEAYFSDSKAVALKLWYIYHIKNEIVNAVHRSAEFYIWGAGKYGTVGKEIVEQFMPKVHIKGFLDLNKKGTFVGYKIYNPKEILQRDNIIVFISSVNGQDEMIKALEEKNMIFNRDYFILVARRW